MRQLSDFKSLETLPMVAYIKDNGGKYVWVNDSFLRVSGFQSATEVIGKDDYALMGDQSLAKSIVDIDKEVFKTGEKLSIIEQVKNIKGKEFSALSFKFPAEIDGKSYLFGFSILEV